MLKKRYLFLIIIICLFTISTVSAEDNATSDIISEGNNVNSLEANSVNNNMNSIAKDNGTLKEVNDELLTAGHNWYVNGSKNSSGDGKSKTSAFKSLNEAINNASDNDTIIIASGEYKGTNNLNLLTHIPSILYVSPNGNDNNLGTHDSPLATLSHAINITETGNIVLLEGVHNVNGLNIDKILNITGEGNVIIDATSTNRIMYIHSTGDIIFSNIKMINGFSSESGALLGNAGNLTLINISLSNSISNNNGGAVYNVGTLTIINSLFENNRANLGGAIYSGGNSKTELNIRIINTTFVDNTALGNSNNKGGGAIYAQASSGNFILENVTFENNNAGKYGGGALYAMQLDNIRISDSKFINNTAESNEYYGGGAITIIGGNYQREGTTTIKNTLFENNNADMCGGAIYLKGTTLDISNSALINSSDTNGIVIYSMPTSSGVNSKITANDNWWGSNDDPKNLITKVSTVTLNRWTKNITVNSSNKKNLTINATSNPITVGENTTINITGLKDATGNVTVTINNKNYTTTITNGKATITVSNLTAGNFIANVTYAGDDNYNPSSTTVNITVNPVPEPIKKNLTLNVTTDSIIVGEDATINVTGLENATGNITTKIKNNTYHAPIVNGTATFTVSNLTSNTTIYIFYEGDDNYNPVNTTVDIIVYPKSDVIIVAENITKYYGGPESFIVKIYNSKNKKPIANKTVKITINGITYNKTTDTKGIASLAIRLSNGTYNVTTTVDNTTVKSNVTVLSTIIGLDLTKYYKNQTQYSVKVYDTKGKPVGKNEIVTFNVNGIFYKRTTDEKGIATLNINLPPSDYIITADYKGCKISNKIKVLPVLNAEDITMKYMDGTQFKANLVDGQGKPYKNQMVTFNVNGIFYNRLTDSNGWAALNIRLPPGEYIITSSFNGCNIANKITVMGVL